jgi:hypothetical protein
MIITILVIYSKPKGNPWSLIGSATNSFSSKHRELPLDEEYKKLQTKINSFDGDE